MKTKEVRELSINDLKERIEAEKANLLRMKMNHAISPIDDLSKMKNQKGHCQNAYHSDQKQI
jgi:large subunit ribosomal protein L29